MRKRSKYYYIESFVYSDGCLLRKNHYFYSRFRDFRSDLFRIIKLGEGNEFLNSEYIRNACVLTKTSSLFTRAHEELSRAYSDGYTSACIFFEYGKE